jgi:hypothetical protein
MTPWRYEFIATQDRTSDVVVLGSSGFDAKDIFDTRKVLSSVIRNIKVSGSTKPNAIRLLDPEGREVWRGLPQGRRRKTGKTD